MANQPVVHFSVCRDEWGTLTVDNVYITNAAGNIVQVNPLFNFFGPPPLTQEVTGNPTGTVTPATVKGGALSSQWNDYTVDLKGPDGGVVKLPVSQVLTANPVTGTPGFSNSTQAEGTFRNAWAGWLTGLYNAIQRLVGASPSITNITFEAPSIDEVDSQWFFYNNAAVDGTTDPLTFDVTEVGSSKFGREIAVGDYII